jgi:putative endonuclease
MERCLEWLKVPLSKSGEDESPPGVRIPLSPQFSTVMFFVYILECNDTSLYTGITNNLKKRILAHNTLKTGAKYTKARRPVTLVYSEEYETKSKALKREAEIKKFTREQKLKLFSTSV